MGHPPYFNYFYINNNTNRHSTTNATMSVNIVGFSYGPSGVATHVHIEDDHGCVHFVPVCFAFQEEEPADLPSFNPTFYQWDDYCSFTGVPGLFTCDEEGNTTFKADNKSFDYTIERDGHEFHGSTEDFAAATAAAAAPAAVVAPVITAAAAAPAAVVAPVITAAAAAPAAVVAPVITAAAAAPAPAIDLSQFNTAFKNAVQSPIRARLDISLDYYTLSIAEEADLVLNSLQTHVSPQKLATLETPEGEHWKSPLAKIVGDLVHVFTLRRDIPNASALFAYSLFHLANSKFVGATAAEKWANLRDLFLRHFTPA
jgi:hypothetical protein